MVDWTGYTLGWLVMVAGAGLWWREPELFWLGAPVMLLGLAILWYADRLALEARQQAWDKMFADEYRPHVIVIRDILGPAQARVRGVTGERWSEVKWLAHDSDAAIVSLVRSLGPTDREAVFEATTQIQGVYRKWSKLSRWSRAFKGWLGEVWHNHDEILRLWMRLEVARDPKCDLGPYGALLRRRGVVPTMGARFHTFLTSDMGVVIVSAVGTVLAVFALFTFKP